MFGKLGDMMGKLQEMKQKADEIKARLESTLLQVEGAGGDVKIEISGTRKIRALRIEPGLQHGNKEELEEQLTVAVNKAIEAADKLNEDEMKKAASGMLPGL